MKKIILSFLVLFSLGVTAQQKHVIKVGISGERLPNGIISAILSNDTTALSIQEIRYNLNGTYFNLGESNHVLAESGDTLRIDIIAVNADGEVVIIQGTPGDPSLPPNYDASTHLVVTYAYAYPDSIVIGTPTGNPKWVDGPNNSIVNTNAGRVIANNGIQSTGGFYLNNLGTGLFGVTGNPNSFRFHTFQRIVCCVDICCLGIIDILYMMDP